MKERKLGRMNEEEKFKLERRKLKYLSENIQLNFAQTLNRKKFFQLFFTSHHSLIN